MQKGKIGVSTDNIFPVIKKFLYSDHEIFLRELVSNAVDATQKLRTLSSIGEFKGELGDLKVTISIDKENGTLTVSDRGIGMTADDIDRFINQIAFSGAEEFLKKYKDTANSIIGHFGLGFYSAFMVSKKVEIHSLSWQEGAKAVAWSCDGSPEYEMQEIEKAERGTDVILYIDDEDKQFLEKDTIDGLLRKYCRFLPVPVVSGKEQEWKDGKYVDTDRDLVINSTAPLWARKPSELTDEDYLNFYREIQPGQDDPLFWIHLNVDYPFTLTGILYFPKIRSNFDINRNRIQLYCNQVFVTDTVEGVVPEFLTLLQGVLDSPDIPLNVSRSYLQADTAVKKISSHITKKVASRLEEIAKNQPEEFQKKWNDIRLFIEYGMLTDEKFCEAALKFMLLEDTEGQYYNLEDYRKLIEATQTDKDGNITVLYATEKDAQYAYISAAKQKGYNVVLLGGQLDPHVIGLLEQKLEKTRFVRVDSDVIDNLIDKGEATAAEVTASERVIADAMFRSALPKLDKAEFLVAIKALASDAEPVVLTQNEFMRRMKDMAAMQGSMGRFYGEMPDSYTLTLNAAHPLVKRIINAASENIGKQVDDSEKELADVNATIDTINKKKAEERTDAEKTLLDESRKRADEIRAERDKLVADYAATQPVVSQLIDIALLGNGLLKGEALSRFLHRSVELL